MRLKPPPFLGLSPKCVYKIDERVGRKMDWAHGSQIVRHLGRLFLQKNNKTFPVFLRSNVYIDKKCFIRLSILRRPIISSSFILRPSSRERDSDIEINMTVGTTSHANQNSLIWKLS